MPEQRQAKTRATLPKGYQFGDAILPLNEMQLYAVLRQRERRWIERINESLLADGTHEPTAETPWAV